MKLDNDFSDKYDEVETKEANWNIAFTILYILGSGFLGLGYVFEQLSKQK